MIMFLYCVAEGEFFDPPDRETMRLQKFGKLLAGPNTDLSGYTLWFACCLVVVVVVVVDVIVVDLL